MIENKLPFNLMRYRSHVFFLFVCLSFSFVQGYSQKVIKGKVTDENGAPLSAVSVIQEGSKTGSSSDDAGNYSITVSKENAVLLFSRVGFFEKKESVSGKTTIDVSLTVRPSPLDEVVVTGLGIKREAKKLGYSAETVKVNEMQQNRTTNFMASLEGKIAGLDVSPPSSGPGASTKIRIRGQSSFAGGGNTPLIVINGLPMDQGVQAADVANGLATDLGDNMQLVNPDDIESMTVLKGATAAAIYGSRAANGALIITTKSGSKNTGLGVEVTSNYASDEVLDFFNFQQEYGQGTNGNRPTSTGTAQQSGQFGWGQRYDGVPTPQFDDVSRPYSPNKNRIKEFFRNGNSFTNTVAVSAGNNKGNFRASFTNQDANGIQPNNSYHKKIFNLGASQNINDKLSISVNINYTNERNVNPPLVGQQGQSMVNFITRMSSTIPLEALKNGAVNADGNEALTSGFGTTLINPYWLMPRVFNKVLRDRFLGTATVRYNFAKWLYLQGRANLDFAVQNNQNNDPTGTAQNPNGAYYDNSKTTYNGSYTTGQSNTKNLNMDFLLGSNQTFGDFSVDLSAGGNLFNVTHRGLNQDVTSFIARDVYTIGNGTVRNQSQTYRERQINSLYAFGEFGWRNMVFVTVTGRNDWFSVLNPKNNSYFYPSVSGSFIFSEVLKGRTNWLNYGKLRASFANVGSENGIDVYNGRLTYGITSLPFGNYSLGVINQGDNPNPNIKPYSVREREVGLELKMFGSRVNLDVAYYQKKTVDQIVRTSNSVASGYNGKLDNVGALMNRGLELMLEVTPIKTPHFTWTSSFNTAMNRTEVLSIAPSINRLEVANWTGGNEFMGWLYYEVGKPINQIAGRSYKRNANGDILLTADGKLQSDGKINLYGGALPIYTGGWNNTFRYKKLSVLVHFDYKAGGKILSSTELNLLRQGHSEASLVGRREGENGVVFPGINETGPNAGKPNTSAVYGQQFYADYRTHQIVDPFIFKSDYIKLRNITVSYDFTSLVNSKFFKGLVLAASVRNAFLLHSHLPNVDPEAVSSSGDTRVGYEAVALPTTRTYGINLNVKF
jgi:TonB-linked SusC/RagA family outer membrane protein